MIWNTPTITNVMSDIVCVIRTLQNETYGDNFTIRMDMILGDQGGRSDSQQEKLNMSLLPNYGRTELTDGGKDYECNKRHELCDCRWSKVG